MYKWQLGKGRIASFFVQVDRNVSFFIHCQSSAQLFLPTDPKQLVYIIKKHCFEWIEGGHSEIFHYIGRISNGK